MTHTLICGSTGDVSLADLVKGDAPQSEQAPFDAERRGECDAPIGFNRMTG
ncbi:hypothetical protein FACS189445_6650 [Spirochaetia bacterium]|nr:hypothetical protein FACS189445_6650 [Spirochaetia bacterium]